MQTGKKKIGLIVNPIAGMGGKVGLKGTDTSEILKKAIALGATPESPRRAAQAFTVLAAVRDDIRIVTYPGEMGETEAKAAGFEVTVLGSITPGATSADDTERAAREIQAFGVELLLFVGGDGTARNIHNAIENRVTALGIPAGVKMHSAVFGTTPRAAGELAVLCVREKVKGTAEAEVMDIDEEAFRNQRVSASLYGYLKVPFERKLMQSIKAGRDGREDAAVGAIALDVVQHMESDCFYIIGPGTTTREIMQALNLPNTLLGVDVIMNKALVANDVNERQLLDILKDAPARIVVTIIGGQGYVFGRGNQQISYKVIQKVGRDHIIVIATTSKIVSLGGSPMLVDTGDEATDRMLSGYVQVTTGFKEKMMCKVAY